MVSSQDTVSQTTSIALTSNGLLTLIEPCSSVRKSVWPQLVTSPVSSLRMGTGPVPLGLSVGGPRHWNVLLSGTDGDGDGAGVDVAGMTELVATVDGGVDGAMVGEVPQAISSPNTASADRTTAVDLGLVPTSNHYVRDRLRPQTWRVKPPLARLLAAAIATLVVVACSSVVPTLTAETPTRTPQAAPTPRSPATASAPASLGEGLFALPTVAALADACGGVGLEPPARLTGDPDDPRVAWIVQDEFGRMDVLFPPGFVARFTPQLEVLDVSGVVAAREGDQIDGGCVVGAGEGDPLLILWP